MQRKKITTTTFSVLNDFAIIITTERYTNGKTNLILPSENLRLYSSSLPTEFTSKSAASSVLFPSLLDQRQKCQKAVRSFKCVIGSQKNKIINFANKLHLGEANKQQRKKNTVTNNFILSGMLREEFPIYIFNHCEEKLWEDDKKLRIWKLSFKNGIYSKMIKSWILTIGHIKVIPIFSTVSIPFLSKPQANHKSLKDASAL